MSQHLLLALSSGLVDRIDDEADRSGVDAGLLLIDLLSEQLPEALADAARHQLTRGREVRFETATPSALTDGVASNLLAAQPQVTQIIPPGGLTDEEPSGGRT